MYSANLSEVEIILPPMCLMVASYYEKDGYSFIDIVERTETMIY